MQPTRNNTGVAHENGAIESPHGHLKNRIKQAIYLRGSNDFQSLDEYRLLIEAAVAKLNQQCQQKYEQEKTQLTTQFDLDTAAVLMVEALYIAATQNQEAAVAD